MKAGFENKNSVIALSVLGLLLAYVFYDNVLSGPSTSTPATVKRTAKSPAANSDSVPPVTSPRTAIPGRANANRAKGDVFLPVYISKRPEDRVNVTNVDPTLRLDLMAKLQTVPPAGSGRDLFSWGQAPAPPVSAKLTGSEPVIRQPPPGPPPPVVPPGPVTPPPPPPFNLKYYGICTRIDNGRRTAFFLEGEEILIATEGAMFSGRYRLLRINVNSALVEDTQNKRQQTLPLAEDAQG